MNILTLGISAVIAMLTGCASITPINNLGLPPVSIIKGDITLLDATGFMLKDQSSAIYVRAQLAKHKNLDLAVNENVQVYGNLLGGQERIFDGYVIEKSNSEQIVITLPTPHMGFIIQSSFK